MNDLDALRGIIDECDKEIVNALERRFLAVKEIMQYKKTNDLEIFQPHRENEVLEKVDSYLNNKEFSRLVHRLYVEIIDQSKKIQFKE